MNDIKRSLRDWIERSAEPVTVDEAIRRTADTESTRARTRRNWIAAIGTAALVLLAVGLPFWLRQADREPDPGPATDPTTAVATVPNWEGSSIDDVKAEADLLEINLHEESTIFDDATPGTVIRQDPQPGEPIPEDRTVTIGVATAPDSEVTTTSLVTTTCPLPESQPRPSERYVTVFYGCETSESHQVQPVLRAIPTETEDLMTAAMESLLKGPTSDQREAGIVTNLTGMASVLDSVTFDSGNVTIGFAPEMAATPLQGRDIAALFATAFQFETTGRVELTIDGSCSEFTNSFDQSCSIDADDWWHEGQAREVIAGWPQVAATPASISGDCETPRSEPRAGEMQVSVVYSCRSGEDSLLELTTVTRLVTAGTDPIRATLNEAVKGPSGAERVEGIAGSFLSERTALMVRNVELEGSRLIVDFYPFVRSPMISNVSTSTGGMIFNTILSANLFQFPEVEEIEYRVDGSCSAYWAIFEADCSIQTRETHERAVEELS